MTRLIWSVVHSVNTNHNAFFVGTMCESIKDDDTDDDKPYTVGEIDQIITADTGGLTLLPSDDYNEVYPNLYIGEE